MQHTAQLTSHANTKINCCTHFHFAVNWLITELYYNGDWLRQQAVLQYTCDIKYVYVGVSKEWVATLAGLGFAM